MPPTTPPFMGTQKQPWEAGEFGRERSIKGQLGVPLSVYPWYL